MSFTCVSCYYNVKNKHDKKYLKWFENTLSIHCPYVFFTTKENIEFIKKCRKGLPTYFIEYNIEDFYTYSFKDKMITHPIHCPSVELNLIWNEKIFMMEKAKEINPFQSEWFQWMDAGICIFRDKMPPQISYPNKDKIKFLPKNKFIYCSSNYYIEKYVQPNIYYHHVSGTSFLLHKNFLSKYVEIYKEYLELIDKNNIWTDQVIHTHIYKKHPELFFQLTSGYGEIVNHLFQSQ
jgi:hypothetical protein